MVIVMNAQFYDYISPFAKSKLLETEWQLKEVWKDGFLIGNGSEIILAELVFNPKPTFKVFVQGSSSSKQVCVIPLPFVQFQILRHLLNDGTDEHFFGDHKLVMC